MKLSYQNIQALLESALNVADVAMQTEEYSYLYVRDVWDDSVVYRGFDRLVYQRSYSIDASNVVTLGDRTTVQEVTTYVPVPADSALAAFTFSADETGPRHKWSGLIFRAGDYGTKGKYGPDELKTFVSNFPATGVTVKDTHTNTFLGKCMELDKTKVESVWTNDDATEVHGTIDSPEWLATATRNLTKTVSIGLNYARDSIEELSLALNPHVTDAALFDGRVAAAFSLSSAFKTFAIEHPVDAAKIVTAASKVPTPAIEDMDKPTFTQRFTAFLAGKTPEQRAALTEEQVVAAIFTEPQTAQTIITDPSIRAELDRLNKRDQEREIQFSASQDEQDGGKFFLEERQAGRRKPHEEADVLAEFALARFKDRNTLATFSANAPESAEAALRARYAARPVQFRLGPGELPSTAKLDLSSTGAFGVFTEEDLGIVKETK